MTMRVLLVRPSAPVRYELAMPRHLDVGDRRALYIRTRGAPSRRTTG
ncbi:hypothetical protein [Streptomyces coeruleorubidus]